MPYDSVFNARHFVGKTYIVTGGGSGIGRCIAHELASLCSHVAIVGRTQSKLDTVVAEIIADGGSASAYALDIRIEDDVKRVIGEILSDAGQVHGLVNNAGGQFPAPLAKISAKGFETVVRNNLTGGFLVARELFTQHMHAQGGSVVNMLADMWEGTPSMGHSGAARAGMLNLTQTAAVEWASAGVRVNGVAPGTIASSGLDSYTDPAFKQVLSELRDGIPLKRLATEAEVSSAVCFLLSPGAAFITGACIRVDGGAPCNSRMYPLPEHDRSQPYNGFHRYKAPRLLSGEDDS